jgi:hypothetical protein
MALDYQPRGASPRGEPRVKLFIAGLIILIPLNGFVLSYSIFLAPLVMIVAPAALVAIYTIMVGGPQRDLELQGKEEMEDWKEMVSMTGGTSIYLSMTSFVWAW